MSIENARRMRELVREIVREELQAVAPAERTARVVSIDAATRTAMVLYLGETEPVRMPYLGVAPSAVDQEVVIGGGPHDRHIVDVKGDSGVESDLSDYKKEREVAHGMMYLSSRTQFQSGAWRTVPFAASYLDPYNLELTSDFGYQVMVPGMYRISSRSALDSELGYLDSRILIMRAANGASEIPSQARLDTNASIVIPLVNETFRPMDRGDRVYVQVWYPNGTFGTNNYYLSGRGDNTLLVTREAPIPT